jgi:probable addiction module antidote protein
MTRKRAKPIRITRYDSAEFLKSEADIAAYIDAVLEEGDPALFAHALGVVARARGMATIARAAGVSREALYRTLSAAGNPELATVLKVMKALGIRLSAAPRDDQFAAKQ